MTRVTDFIRRSFGRNKLRRNQRRHDLQQSSAELVRTSQTLEQRALLTLAMNFDFTGQSESLIPCPF